MVSPWSDSESTLWPRMCTVPEMGVHVPSSIAAGLGVHGFDLANEVGVQVPFPTANDVGVTGMGVRGADREIVLRDGAAQCSTA